MAGLASGASFGPSPYRDARFSTIRRTQPTRSTSNASAFQRRLDKVAADLAVDVGQAILIEARKPRPNLATATVACDVRQRVQEINAGSTYTLESNPRRLAVIFGGSSTVTFFLMTRLSTTATEGVPVGTGGISEVTREKHYCLPMQELHFRNDSFATGKLTIIEIIELEGG